MLFVLGEYFDERLFEHITHIRIIEYERPSCFFTKYLHLLKPHLVHTSTNDIECKITAVERFGLRLVKLLGRTDVPGHSCVLVVDVVVHAHLGVLGDVDDLATAHGAHAAGQEQDASAADGADQVRGQRGRALHRDARADLGPVRGVLAPVVVRQVVQDGRELHLAVVEGGHLLTNEVCFVAVFVDQPQHLFHLFLGVGASAADDSDCLDLVVAQLVDLDIFAECYESNFAKLRELAHALLDCVFGAD